MGDYEVLIRPARKEDMEAVYTLTYELAEYIKMPNGPMLNATVLQKDGFETFPPAFTCLVAETPTERRIVGYALYFPMYSTFVGRTMMLQDLIVTDKVRGCGVGKKLFKAVAKEAASSGCIRLDFHVLGWNRARTFYEALGATNLSDQYELYRLTGEALQQAAFD